MRLLMIWVVASVACQTATHAGPVLEGSTPSVARPRALVGAIRWDAWHGDRGGPGMAVQKSLGPERWHYRLPFYAQVVSDTEVKTDGASQAVIDQEIAYAHGAGLDYWAFVTYEPDSPMSLGLQYYLASDHKQDVSFCLVTSPSNLGTKANHRQMEERLVRLMTEPTYQKVLAGRPLLYVGFITDGWVEACGGPKDSRLIFDHLRSAAQQAGLANPYIVVMDFDPQRGKELCDILGGDAISSYAASGGGEGAPYSELAQYAQGFWDRCKATGSQVVPIVMSGWDRRPRVENPVPWETWQKPGEGIQKYYQPPTPVELAAHLEAALAWLDANPQAAEARTALTYAWNENDEGGWLVPTLSEGASRLDAIRRVLRSSRGA